MTFITATAFGQELTRKEILQHKIKSVAVVDNEGKVKSIDIYNDSGYILKSGTADQNGNFQVNRDFAYNISGNIVEERAYTTNGTINSVDKYFYDTEGLLVKKEHSDANGNFKSIWQYEYDSKGNRLKEVQTSGTMGNKETTYKYDSNSLLIEENKFNSTIGKESSIWYTYGEKGQIIQKKTKHYFGGATVTHTYEYNASGKLVKLAEKSSNGVTSVTIYQYDGSGLLLSDIWKGSFSKTGIKTTYRIFKD